MRLNRRKILTSLLALFGGLLLCGMATIVYVAANRDRIHIRIRSSQPRLALREAEALWNDGNYVRALPRFAGATAMVVENSIRWRISDAYVQQMDAYRENGDLEAYFENCDKAMNVLGRYDGGDPIGERCWDIYMQDVKQTGGGAQ